MCICASLTRPFQWSAVWWICCKNAPLWLVWAAKSVNDMFRKIIQCDLWLLCWRPSWRLQIVALYVPVSDLNRALLSSHRPIPNANKTMTTHVNGIIFRSRGLSHLINVSVDFIGTISRSVGKIFYCVLTATCRGTTCEWVTANVFFYRCYCDYLTERKAVAGHTHLWWILDVPFTNFNNFTLFFLHK